MLKKALTALALGAAGWTAPAVAGSYDCRGIECWDKVRFRASTAPSSVTSSSAQDTAKSSPPRRSSSAASSPSLWLPPAHTRSASPQFTAPPLEPKWSPLRVSPGA